MKRRLKNILSEKCYDIKNYDFTQNSQDITMVDSGVVCFDTKYLLSLKFHQVSSPSSVLSPNSVLSVNSTDSSNFIFIKKENNECGLYSIKKLCTIFTSQKIVYKAGCYVGIGYVYDVSADVLYKGVPESFVLLEIVDGMLFGHDEDKMMYLDTSGRIVYSFCICSFVKNYIGIQRTQSGFNIIDAKSGLTLAKLQSENYGLIFCDQTIIVYDHPDSVRVFRIEENNVDIVCCVCKECKPDLGIAKCGCTSICKSCQTTPCHVCLAI